MLEDAPRPFALPSVQRKKVTAAFDGGRLTSDGGVMLLAAIETRLGIAAGLVPLIADPRHPAFVTHSVADILRVRMLAIACGYEDGDDLDHLRTDPGFKLACGRLPDSGRILLRPHQRNADAPLVWFVTALHTPQELTRGVHHIGEGSLCAKCGV